MLAKSVLLASIHFVEGLGLSNAEELSTPFGAGRGKDRTGLGLGLNISRKAVKTFGGDICIRNLPGKGCIFTI